MKKIILSLLLTSCLFLPILAQDRYAKHILQGGINDAVFHNWKSNSSILIPNATSYVFYFHKNWGVGCRYEYAKRILNLEESKKFIVFTQGTSYIVLNHILIRKLHSFDVPLSYRFSSQKHSFIGSLGIGIRKDIKSNVSREFDDSYRLTVQESSDIRLGYCASLAYQFRVYRNFGLSADVVLRGSKDIPTTLSYGVGLTYSIFNKKKDQ
jgi:hypothetical protein